MAMHDLPNWLLTNAGFRKRFIRLTTDSVCRQFTTVKPSNENVDLNSQLGYLLTCASVLAHSQEGECQDAALRIAQYCLLSPNVSDSRKDGAALVLDALVNRPAIRLAESRGLIKPGYDERLPISAQQESTKRRLLYTVELTNESRISTNRFQTEVWDAVKRDSWVSVSAPTSAGKSFILETWIDDFVRANPRSLVVYLVPTRALITEVESELKKKLADADAIVNVSSLPLKKVFVGEKANLMVFTQERFQIFLNSFAEAPKVDALIVDEAHKIGDRHRGVFLQHVIELAARNNPSIKLVFASPFTENPEILLEDGPRAKSSVIKRRDVTVNQNLIWVTQKPRSPKDWKIELCLPTETIELGTFQIPYSPTTVGKRLPFVALALAGGQPGNIIYVNGAAEAEKTARLIWDSFEDLKEIDDEILQLVELCEKTIHKNFLLVRTLKRGVAFHYGNMPLLVKSEIERLFSLNKIAFLVCTSTLVEGVNMACRNIFVRGPKKGRTSLMNADDFWNLAGRAGRWGREFQGNVFCVDSDHEELWKDGHPPRSKMGVRIKRTTDEVIRNPDLLIDYIQSPDHLPLSRTHPEWEHVFSYLFINYNRFGTLLLNPYLVQRYKDSLHLLDQVMHEVADKISVPAAILYRNPGISPLLMESLLQRFGENPEKPVERLLLSDPSSDDALDSFTAAFARISGNLSQAICFNSKQAYIRALLVVRWMRGFPLARLITQRIDYLKSKHDFKNEASVIREVMTDVEEIARYQAPRLLACYNDVLGHYLEKSGRTDLQEHVRDLSVYLELGVNQQTQISLMGIGLSRTAAVLLSELIARDDLSEEQCARWLLENSWHDSDLPALVKAEVDSSLKRFTV